MTPKNVRQVKQTIAPLAEHTDALERHVMALEADLFRLWNTVAAFQQLTFRGRLRWLLRGTWPFAAKG